MWSKYTPFSNNMTEGTHDSFSRFNMFLSNSETMYFPGSKKNLCKWDIYQVDLIGNTKIIVLPLCVANPLSVKLKHRFTHQVVSLVRKQTTTQWWWIRTHESQSYHTSCADRPRSTQYMFTASRSIVTFYSRCIIESI